MPKGSITLSINPQKEESPSELSEIYWNTTTKESPLWSI